jgi:hypothetical protein
MAALNFPSNPTDGQIYNAASGVIYQYNHARRTWTTVLTGTAGSSTANPSATPPLNPIFGSFWMDTDSNSLYVYVNNSGVGEWQKVAGGTGTSSSTSTPGLALEGTAVYDGDIVLNDIGIFLETLPES